MFSKTALYSLIGHPWFCLIFILSKSKAFQSVAILKMPTSSTSMAKAVKNVTNHFAKASKGVFILPTATFCFNASQNLKPSRLIRYSPTPKADKEKHYDIKI